jgi:hypothetical protein
MRLLGLEQQRLATHPKRFAARLGRLLGGEGGLVPHLTELRAALRQQLAGLVQDRVRHAVRGTPPLTKRTLCDSG